MSLAVPSIIGNKNVLYPYAGGTVQWVSLFNNLTPYNFDGGNAIAVDSEQNVYVAGFTGRGTINSISNTISSSTIYIQGTTQDLSAQRPPFRSTGAIIIKYTVDGNPQWCRFVDYSGNINISGQLSQTLITNRREDIGIGLTLDPSNNIYMCGQHYGNNIEFSNGDLSNIYIDISNINNASGTFTQNAFIIKYNSLGNAQWGHIIAPKRATDVTSPSIEYNSIYYYNNNIYIGGRGSIANFSNGDAYLFTKNNINQTYDSSFSINPILVSNLLLLISINSNIGKYNWHTYISNGTSTNSSEKIKSIMAYNNNIYFAGNVNVNTNDSTILYSSIGANTPTITLSYPNKPRNNSILLGKYNLSGNPLAAKYIDSFIDICYNYSDNISKIIFDNSGNLIITGSIGGYILDLSDLSYSRPDLTSSTIRMDEAMFIAKYDTSLNPIKARIIDTYRRDVSSDTYTSDIGNSIAVDSRNNIYVVGALTDSSDNSQFVIIDNAIINRYNAGGRSYAALLQLNSDLSAQWGIAIDNTSVNYRAEEIRDIAIDKYDNIYVTGYGPGFSNNSVASTTGINNSLLFGNNITNIPVIKSMGTINGFNYDICGFSGSHGFVAKYSPGYVNIYPEQDGEQIKLSYYHTKPNKNLLKYNLIDTATSIVDASFSNKGFADISYTITTQPANTRQYLIQLSNVKTNNNKIVKSLPFTYNPIPAIELAGTVSMNTTIQGTSSLNGIAVDSKGYIYVCDVLQHCVRRFNPTFNDTSGVVVAGNAGNGCFSGFDLTCLLNPIQIVIDSSDNLYVIDKLYEIQSQGPSHARVLQFMKGSTTATRNLIYDFYNYLTPGSNKNIDTWDVFSRFCLYINNNTKKLYIPFIMSNNTNKIVEYNYINNTFFIINTYVEPQPYDSFIYLNGTDNIIYSTENNRIIFGINTYAGIYDNEFITSYTLNSNIINKNNTEYDIYYCDSSSINLITNESKEGTRSKITIINRTNTIFNSLSIDTSNNIYAIYNNNSLLIKSETVQLWVDGQYNTEQQRIELQWGLIGNLFNSNIYYNVYKNNILLEKTSRVTSFNDIINQTVTDVSFNYKIETVNKYNGLRISKNIIINIPGKAPQFIYSPNPITLKSNSYIKYNDFSFNLIPSSGTINIAAMIVNITLRNNTNQTTSSILYTNPIIFPDLSYNSQYDVTIDISNILITNNNIIYNPISISNKIVLQPTGILSTPIFNSIGSQSLYNTTIFLSNIDQKSYNDISYAQFIIDDSNNIIQSGQYKVNIITGGHYIDLVNLELFKKYNNAAINIIYKGNNSIKTSTFSFNTYQIYTSEYIRGTDNISIVYYANMAKLGDISNISVISGGGQIQVQKDSFDFNTKVFMKIVGLQPNTLYSGMKVGILFTNNIYQTLTLDDFITFPTNPSITINRIIHNNSSGTAIYHTLNNIIIPYDYNINNYKNYKNVDLYVYGDNTELGSAQYQYSGSNTLFANDSSLVLFINSNISSIKFLIKLNELYNMSQYELALYNNLDIYSNIINNLDFSTEFDITY